MSLPEITDPPEEPPLRNEQDEEAFISAWNAFLAWLFVFVGQIKTAIEWISDQLDLAEQAVMNAQLEVALAADEVEAAEEQVALAVQAREGAEAARDIASAVGNYQGDYNALTTYQIGQSVSSGGGFFQAKTINTGVTPVDGLNWRQIASIKSEYQEFLTSGTWTKPAGVTWVYIEAIGGGGSGASFTSSSDRGGGGGGAFSSKLIRASELASSIAITIGAGGSAVSADASGNTGGDTTFGSHLVARGGKPGVASSGGDGGAGERGGIGVNAQGHGGYSSGGGGVGTADGGSCVKGGGGGGGGDSGTAGAGGLSIDGGNGGAGLGTSSDGHATSGSVPGGGGGARTNSNGAARMSGAGGNGRVRVWAW